MWRVYAYHKKKSFSKLQSLYRLIEFPLSECIRVRSEIVPLMKKKLIENRERDDVTFGAGGWNGWRIKSFWFHSIEIHLIYASPRETKLEIRIIWFAAVNHSSATDRCSDWVAGLSFNMDAAANNKTSTDLARKHRKKEIIQWNVKSTRHILVE